MSNLQLKIVLNAIGNARQQFDDIANAGTVAGRKIRELRRDVRSLEGAQKTFNKFRESRQALQGLNQQLGRTQSEIKQLSQTISASGVATAAQTAKMEELRKKAKALKDAKKQLQQQSQALRASLAAQGIDTRSLSNGQNQLRDRTNAANRTLQQQQQRLQQLNTATERYQRAQARASSLKSAAGTAAIGGAGTVGALAMPVKAFADSEAASNNLKISMMQADGSYGRHDELNALAIKMGKELPGGKANFVNMFRGMKAQGLSDNTILKGGGYATANLNIVIENELEDGSFFAKMMEAHGINPDSERDLTKSADMTQRAYFAAGLTKDDMYQAMSYYAPKVNTLGLTGTENQKQIYVVEGLAAMKGLEGSSFGTNFAMLLSQLSRGPKMIEMASKGMKAEVKNMLDSSGATFEFFKKDGTIKSLREITQELETGFNKIRTKFGDQGVMDVSDALFGQEGGRVAAIMGQAGIQGFDGFEAKMDAQASLDQRIEEKLKTLVSHWDAASGAFTNFMIAMGASVESELKAILTWMTNVNDKLYMWSAANPKLAASIMKVIAIVAIALVTFAAIATVIAAVLGPFALLRLSLVHLAPVFAQIVPLLGLLKMAFIVLGKAVLANPIILVITAIIAVLYLLWTNWDTVKAWLIASWNSLCTFAISIWNSIKNAIVSAWNGLINWINNISVYQIIVSQWNSVTTFLSGLVGTMQNLGTSIVQGLINGIQSRLGLLRSMWQSATSIFSSSQPKPSTPSSIKGFSSGGYTGHGSKYEVAGIVHKGEGVLSQREIAAIGGPSGFSRLRHMIGVMGGRAMGGLNLLNESKSQPKPHFAEAVSMGSAMSMADGGNVQAAGMGDVSITININGSNQQPQSIASEVKRQLQDLFADMQRKAKTSFRDKD